MTVYTYEYTDAQGESHKGPDVVLATNPCRALRKAATALDNHGIEAWQIKVKAEEEDWW